MRTVFRRFLCVLSLLALTACSGARFSSFPNRGLFASTWGGFIASPSSQFFVMQPGTTLIIIVQQSPFFFFEPPEFFNTFIGANPNLGTFCPAVGTIGSTLISTGGSFVQIVFTPIGFGNCVFPIDLGAGGIATFNVQVSANGTKVQVRKYQR